MEQVSSEKNLEWLGMKTRIFNFVACRDSFTYNAQVHPYVLFNVSLIWDTNKRLPKFSGIWDISVLKKTFLKLIFTIKNNFFCQNHYCSRQAVAQIEKETIKFSLWVAWSQSDIQYPKHSEVAPPCSKYIDLMREVSIQNKGKRS